MLPFIRKNTSNMYRKYNNEAPKIFNCVSINKKKMFE